LEIADQYRQQDNATAISEADLAFLAKEGLNVASLVQATARTSISKPPMSAVEVIQRNAILLFELHKLQEERFSSKNQTIGARERDLGKNQSLFVWGMSRFALLTFICPCPWSS